MIRVWSIEFGVWARSRLGFRVGVMAEEGKQWKSGGLN
jgi:hypothetical protein